MSLSTQYPLAMPTHTGFTQISLRAIEGSLVTRSPFSFKEQTQTFGGQRWEADITLPPMKRDAAETWIAWLMSLKGPRGKFYLSDPTATTPRGSARDADAVTIVNNGSTIIPANDTIYISKGSSAVTGYLKAGDYIQIGVGTDGTQNLHKVLQDVNLASDGSATVYIWPNIRRAAHKVNGYSDIKFQSSSGIFRLQDSSVGWDINNAMTYGLTFGAIEHVVTDLAGEIGGG